MTEAQLLIQRAIDILEDLVDEEQVSEEPLYKPALELMHRLRKFDGVMSESPKLFCCSTGTALRIAVHGVDTEVSIETAEYFIESLQRETKMAKAWR